MKSVLRSLNNFNKIITPVLLLIFFTSCGKSQDNSEISFKSGPAFKRNKIVEQDKKELIKQKEKKIKARYKYVTFYKYDGTLPEDRTLVEKILFNKNGLRTEHLRYKSTGEIDLVYTFKYDEKGRVVEMVTRNGQDMIMGKKQSVFDKNGNEIEQVLINQRGTAEVRSVTEYDKDGNFKEIKNYSPKGDVVNTQTFMHNGNVSKSIDKGFDGRISQEVDLTYNEMGLLIKEETKTPAGNIVVTYKYDEKGNLIEHVNPQYRRTYIYNENGDLLLDELITTEGVRQFKVKFTYDKNGMQKEEVRYTADDKPAFYGVYEYEFFK
jgi:YD repeat-containing protein